MADILTEEECQAIIDYDHNWKMTSLARKDGCIIECKTSDFRKWSDRHPSILKEWVVKYDIGDFVTEHTDTDWGFINPNYIAHAVWFTPLNNDYEGGELYVDGERMEQVVGVPIKRLRTTPHEVTKVTKGTRYSLVAWVFIKNLDIEKKARNIYNAKRRLR